MTVKVSKNAFDNRDGMTLEELAQFVQECMRLNIDPKHRIKSITGLRAQLQKVETR